MRGRTTEAKTIESRLCANLGREPTSAARYDVVGPDQSPLNGKKTTRNRIGAKRPGLKRRRISKKRGHSIAPMIANESEISYAPGGEFHGAVKGDARERVEPK